MKVSTCKYTSHRVQPAKVTDNKETTHKDAWEVR